MLINLNIITIEYEIKKLDRNRQWRIQGCANTRGGCTNLLFGIKWLQENQRNWTGARRRGVFLQRSFWIRQ